LEAARHTARELDAKAAALAGGDIAPDVSVVVFGSWARDELRRAATMTGAIVVARAFADYDPEVVRAMALVQQHFGGEERPPGSQAVFGVPFDVNGLVTHIGLDADTNRNLTRRMLLLLESRELAGGIHADCWKAVLDRYLRFGNQAQPATALPSQRPRSLLAHHLCGLRRQAPRHGRRRPEVGNPQRQAAHVAEAALRGRADPDPPSRRTIAGSRSCRTARSGQSSRSSEQPRAIDRICGRTSATSAGSFIRGLNVLLFETPLNRLAPQYAIF
jgi:hypothetical protein